MQSNENTSKPQGTQYSVSQSNASGQESRESFPNTNQTAYSAPQGSYTPKKSANTSKPLAQVVPFDMPPSAASHNHQFNYQGQTQAQPQINTQGSAQAYMPQTYGQNPYNLGNIQDQSAPQAQVSSMMQNVQLGGANANYAHPNSAPNYQKMSSVQTQMKHSQVLTSQRTYLQPPQHMGTIVQGQAALDSSVQAMSSAPKGVTQALSQSLAQVAHGAHGTQGIHGVQGGQGTQGISSQKTTQHHSAALGPMLDADDAYTPSSNILKPKVMAKGAFSRLMDMLESKLPPAARQDLANDKPATYEDYLQMKREENIAIQQSVRASQNNYYKEYVANTRISNDLNPDFTFDKIKFDHLNYNALNFSQQFARNMDAHLGSTLLLLLGGPGTGKTVACHAIAQLYIQLKYNAQIKDLRRPDLPLVVLSEFNEITSLRMYSFSENPQDRSSKDRRFDEICNVDLLIIDDLCDDDNALTPFAQKVLAEILSYRREINLPIVIASPVSNIDIADKIGIRSFERMNSYNVIATCLEGTSRRPRAIKIKKWEGNTTQATPYPNSTNGFYAAGMNNPGLNNARMNQLGLNNSVGNNPIMANVSLIGNPSTMGNPSLMPSSALSNSCQNNSGMNNPALNNNAVFAPNRPLELKPNDNTEFKSPQELSTRLGPLEEFQPFMPKITGENDLPLPQPFSPQKAQNREDPHRVTTFYGTLNTQQSQVQNVGSVGSVQSQPTPKYNPYLEEDTQTSSIPSTAESTINSFAEALDFTHDPQLTLRVQQDIEREEAELRKKSAQYRAHAKLQDEELLEEADVPSQKENKNKSSKKH